MAMDVIACGLKQGGGEILINRFGFLHKQDIGFADFSQAITCSARTLMELTFQLAILS